MKNNKLGNHIIIDFYECDISKLGDPQLIKEIMEDAASTMNATIITSMYHHFSPLGVSGVTVISESHIAIHTWPEYCFAAVDIFYCGILEIDLGIEKLKSSFGSNRIEIKEIFRGDKMS